MIIWYRDERGEKKFLFTLSFNFFSLNSSERMVQHCVNAASTDFGSYNSKKQRDAADVVGR